jgi:5-methylcytosine-specific restriction endonuclease McrA
MGKRRDPAYDWEWDQFVIGLVRERGRICESTLHAGVRSLTILQVVYGDHIVELRDGGAKLDPANVQLNCARCHGKKTHQERQRRNGNAASGERCLSSKQVTGDLGPMDGLGSSRMGSSG